jgi:hypothetical protein
VTVRRKSIEDWEIKIQEMNAAWKPTMQGGKVAKQPFELTIYARFICVRFCILQRISYSPWFSNQSFRQG